MEQDNQQLNIDETVDTSKRKRSKWIDIILWVIIIVLLVVIVARTFVVSKVTVAGESMTAAYYNEEGTDHYFPSLTYHDGDTVKVNMLAKPKRGDVVVFYKNAVKSKFLGKFARGDKVEPNGEYYKLIKRVVALGGDKLWLENIGGGNYKIVILTPNGDRLYEDYYELNGEKLSIECFILSGYNNLGSLADCTEQDPLVVEEGYFFAIGDNRVNSADSRGALGQVPLSQLFGVVV